jgi:hypothetical protein
MSFQNDIRTLWTEEIDVEGRKFEVKHLKGSENDEFILRTHYQEEENGPIMINIKERNKFYLTSLIVDAPYSWNDKPWKELSELERWELMEKLDHHIRGLLIQKIHEVKEGGELKKKLD